jgi:hypothetical protein
MQRERLAVPPSVIGLGDVLLQERVRQVAVDALGSLVMTGLSPRVVLIVHDVAVGAGCRVNLKIAQPLAVMKRVSPQPDDSTKKHRRWQQERTETKHPICVSQPSDHARVTALDDYS